MTGGAEESVLKRMASARGKPPSSGSAMTPSKALRSTMARVGEDKLSVQVGMLGLVETSGAPDDVTKDLPDPSLILRLNGPDQSIGLAIICPQITAAVIEAKTVGHVIEGEAQARKATRTDAMLVGGFLDHALSRFAVVAEGCAEIPAVQGYKTGVTLPDARVATMALADEKHIRYQIELDFSGGAKKGQLILIFPTVSGKKAEIDPAQEAWHGTMEKAVLGANSRLEAVLCRMRMPLSELTSLAVGDVLKLKNASLDNVSILAADRTKIVTAQLGRSGPTRAVRVYLDCEPPKRTPPPEDMVPLTMGDGAMAGGAMGGGIGPMEGIEEGGLQEAPAFALPSDQGEIPSFAPPEEADSEVSLPEGGFPMNRLEVS